MLARSDDTVMVVIILNNVIIICRLSIDWMKQRGSVCTVNVTDRKRFHCVYWLPDTPFPQHVRTGLAVL